MSSDIDCKKVRPYKGLRSICVVLLMYILTVVAVLSWMLLLQKYQIIQKFFNLLETKPNKNTFLDGPTKEILRLTPGNPLDNSSLAKYLYKEVRVICWALTCPGKIKRSIHLLRTWGRRCNEFELFSTVPIENHNITFLNNITDPQNIWMITIAVHKHLYSNYRNHSDWFFRADDCTFTIMENLRFMLYPYPPDTALYFGCKFDAWPKMGYTEEGSSFVLSHEALRQFNDSVEELCNSNVALIATKDEYSKLEMCLRTLNISMGDTRDKNTRRRLFPTKFQNHTIMRGIDYRMDWMVDYAFYRVYEGFNCCSNYFITFHYVRPQMMYSLEYLLYYLRPYGMEFKHDMLPPKLLQDNVGMPVVKRNVTLH